MDHLPRASRRPGARALCCLLSLFFFLAAGPAPAAAADRAAGGLGYVALGDSYSAGVGAGDYEAASGACKRSRRSFPALWSAAHAPGSFASGACIGAGTEEVASGQLGLLNRSTGLVSITVGANDAGFGETMTTCVLRPEADCLARVEQARAYIGRTLPGRLDRVYGAIADKAPAARVVVMGYPRLYRLGGSCLAGLSERSRAALNAAADELNAVAAKRAADHGFAFGDVAAAFEGHEICSAAPWIHSLAFPVENSYHPTAAGQSHGYLPVFSSAV
ncbi:SGNH/GDSL hydrolase family protein [Streptomyces sp. PR69]|uniref:SGNH/GDSL hydrolase family protein n=1 Tax=Streptomyces sp. PR69 TaxID=2984950 RepID=UPI002263FF86|nr:SGNH/GDSL hydrolase family protein [Streptomyces sp. PR69]